MANDIQKEEGKELTKILVDGDANIDNGYTPKIPDTSQFYCDAMNDGNINMVLNDVKPELIVLMAFADYGKSTFVGSLYHYLLNKGTIEGYDLYDSDTFAGFERRFYLRNIKNDPNAKSRTLRTDENDEYMMTLTFYNKTLKEKKQLIISDRPGETYRKYVDTKAKINEDQSLPRAQRVIIMVDTAQVNNWDVLRGRFKQLFNGLKEYHKMPTDATYTLLFNKIDLVRNNESMQKAYNATKQEIFDFFCEEIGLVAADLDCREIDSKHALQDDAFKTFVKDLVRKDDSSKSEEQKLKKMLDWVGEKIK